MFRGQSRILAVYLFYFLAFSGLLGRLYYIQFIEGPDYAKQAASQRMRTVDLVQYSRGQITDREGQPLTNTEQQPCVVVFPVMIKDFTGTAQVLSQVLNVPQETVRARLGERKNKGSWQVVKNPFVLKANVGEKAADLIKQAALPGVYILPLVPRYSPDYPAVHLLGYVGDIGLGEITQVKDEVDGNNLIDTAGKTGLEKQYESFLRGEASQKVGVLIDDRGRALEGRGFTLLPAKEKENNTACDVNLTIDADCQRIVEEELAGRQGSVVVMDVYSGDILAIASSPKFDPYLLGEPETSDAYVNKAVQNYHPASVFKILIAAAALEEGVVHPKLFGYLPLGTAEAVA